MEKLKQQRKALKKSLIGLINIGLRAIVVLNSGTGGTTDMVGKKPKCKLIGENGNIFFILGKVNKALKASGKNEEAIECSNRVMNSKSYDEALQIIMEYVEIE